MIGPQLPSSLKRGRESVAHENEPPSKRSKLNKEEHPNQSKENKLMHSRNIYRYNKPNFYELALKYDFFQNVLKVNRKTGEHYINYNEAKSAIMLTKALLKNDFNLEFEHPINHLCPPITQRLNYILWIQDLLQCIHKTEKDKKYHGFDIGVGASCILPLLGLKIGEKQNELWSFIASDIDTESIQFAKNNVKINNLDKNIEIIHQIDAKHIFKGIIDNCTEKHMLFDFTVCNPPFFEHLQETGLNKCRSNNATPSELVYEDGGEIGFIQLMMNEIKELKLYHKVHWFTTMFGKKTSIKAVKSILNKEKEKAFIITTEFVQGKQVRWGLAWTYNVEIKNKYNVLYKALQHNDCQEMSKKQEFLFDLVIGYDLTDYNSCLMKEMQILFKKYGIKYDAKSLRNESNNKWIEIDDINNNGFTFSMKWIVKPNNHNDKKKNKNKKMKLSIFMSIRYHQGDKLLFDGFVEWFRESLVTLN